MSGGSAKQPIGRTFLFTEEILGCLEPRAICASFCKLFRFADRPLSHFVFRFLRHIRESGELGVTRSRSASALLNFQYQPFLKEQRVIIPTSVLLNEFASVQETILRQQHTLAIQNHRLRGARDLLLPRLMSGEIAV